MTESEKSYSAFEAKQARFRDLCRDAMQRHHEQGTDGIGTLAEKRMHVILKKYVCPNQSFYEIPLDGTRYVSDIRIGNEIYEIQTGDFFPMKKKIGYYLEHTDCTVTIVHPIVVNKWVVWIDPVSRSVSEKIRSPKHERAEDILPTLYPLLPYLKNDRLRFRFLLIEAIDFKILSKGTRNRKKGAEKYERIPLSLLGEMDFLSVSDFSALLPDALPSSFTVKEFSALTKIRGMNAYSAVRVLEALGFLSEGEKRGRAMTFEKSKNA